jgi:hypothetical protein
MFLLLGHWHIGNEIMDWPVSGFKMSFARLIGVAGFFDGAVTRDIMTYAAGGG